MQSPARTREPLPVVTFALGVMSTIGPASGKKPIRIDPSRSVSGPAAWLGDPSSNRSTPAWRRNA